MSAALRARVMCGRRRQARRPSAPDDEAPADKLFGVVIFDTRQRRARRVVLAFDSMSAADAYAVDNRFRDYVVVPLSFLAPAGVPAVA